MSNDNWEGTGYDVAANDGSGGKFFRLKTKGQEARLRLVTAAYRFHDTLHQDGQPDKVIKKAAWGAILKEMVSGKLERRAVIFINGPMVYGLLKDLNDDESWGDPSTYDVKITRTEEQGKYYSVMPLPNKDPKHSLIPDSDKELLKAIGIETAADIKSAMEKKDEAKPEADPYNPYDDE